MLESTCCTIINELGGSSDTSGDLTKLVKNTRQQLGLQTGKTVSREVNELISGIGSITNALAAISNSAGDRHGSESGLRLENSTVASIAVHAAGILSYSLSQIYIDRSFHPTQSKITDDASIKPQNDLITIKHLGLND